MPKDRITLLISPECRISNTCKHLWLHACYYFPRLWGD